MSQHLENADNAMTVITVGSVGRGRCSSQVAPPRSNKQSRRVGRSPVVRQGEEKIQADVSDNHGPEFHAQRIALLPRHIHGRCAVVTFLVHGWFWSSVGSITFIALPYLVAMYGIVRTRKQALKDYIDFDDIDWDYGYDTKKKILLVLFFLFSPILPLVFDVFLMPFHGFMGRCIGDNLSNFMTQYEATRTLSETVMESIPQLCLQLYMVIYCRMNGCNFQAEEGGDAALMQALVISISSIVYRLVMTCFEMQKENLTLREYLRSWSVWVMVCHWEDSE